MISCKDPQSAGIDGQGFMQAEFCREIDNRPVIYIAAVYNAPGLVLFDIFIQPPEGMVDTAVEHQFGGAFLHLFRGDLLQEGDRVVLDLAPECWVQIREDADNLRMPCPLEVVCQCTKTFVKMVDRFCHTYAPSYSVEQDRSPRKSYYITIITDDVA